MPESATTKKAIADGFKAIMEKKSFEKITITDITDQCGLNRQTFYYHFQDKYELLNWILLTEVISPFTENLTTENWNDKLLQILLVLYDNSKFYANAFSTSHGNEFRQFLFNTVTDVMSDIIDLIAEDKPINADDKQFLAEFFSYGVSGSVTKWVTTGMKQSPEKTAKHIQNIVNGYKAFAASRQRNTYQGTLSSGASC